MTYQLPLASAFNDTSLRSRHLTPISGMCSFCTEECPGTCEIALAAVLGKRAVYPTNTGNNQVASEKAYPIDYSHFNINGRVFGAVGAWATYEETGIYQVDLEQTYGFDDPVKLALPFILPALIKLNWQDYFAGAAMAGVSAVIGEEARDKDPDLVIEGGKIRHFPALAGFLAPFRRYNRGYGEIILQCNVEDDMLGLPEYALSQHGVEAIEFKFGQAAKGTQPARPLKDRAEAIKKQKEGMIIHPDPQDPKIQVLEAQGLGPNYYSYARLPLWDEAYLVKRIDNLRKIGVRHIYLKMAGYDVRDLERVMRLGSEAKVDMITFDGAGGGTGYSPCKMMNEWGYPALLIQALVCRLAREMKNEGLYLPALTLAGGFASEDQAFKALAFGEGAVTAIGFCRAAMTAAMTGKAIGQRIKAGDIPKNMRQYGSQVEDFYADIRDLRGLYGQAANDFSLGAVGVYSYLNKLAFGLQHFAALNRKYDLEYLDRTDLIPLTGEAKALLQDSWF